MPRPPPDPRAPTPARRRRWRASAVGGLVLGAGLLAWAALWRPAPAPRPGSPGWSSVRVGGAVEALDEASGLAPARRPGSLWTHADSLGPARLYRLDPTPGPAPGATLGLVVDTDAGNRDWEDITAFTAGGARWLVVADTGNNLGLPRDGRLWLLREPADGARGRLAARPRKVPVRFPGPAPDIEAVAADSTTGVLLLLSKRDRRPRVFTLPLAALAARALGPPDDTPLEAREAGPAGLPATASPGDWPTALAVSADGTTAAVVTAHDAIFWNRRPAEDWPAALTRRYDAYIGLPSALARAEGAALSADGRTLFVVGESRPLHLWRWRAPPGFVPATD